MTAQNIIFVSHTLSSISNHYIFEANFIQLQVSNCTQLIQIIHKIQPIMAAQNIIHHRLVQIDKYLTSIKVSNRPVTSYPNIHNFNKHQSGISIFSQSDTHYILVHIVILYICLSQFQWGSCCLIIAYLCSILAIVLSVRLRITPSDYPFGIFKHVLCKPQRVISL